MRDLIKKGEFSFVWIFAILAGGSILVLAIYGAVQTGDSLRYKSDTEIGKSISILTDPLQAGFADSSYGKIVFQQETRLNNICFDGEFGKNDISIATRSGVGEDWNLAGGATSVHNKYIFSKEKNEGFDYYVFSKPFNFPYKVSDLIFLMDGDYCFLGAPDEIIEEVGRLGIDNIIFGAENCSSGAEKVCFGSNEGSCDSIVYGSCSGNCDSVYDEGVVSKSGAELRYIGNLMWGAIFSDNAVYECNVKRLMFRTAWIAEVFSEKADYMNARDCGTGLKGEMITWRSMVSESGSEDLMRLRKLGDDLEKENDREVCGLW